MLQEKHFVMWTSVGRGIVENSEVFLLEFEGNVGM